MLFQANSLVVGTAIKIIKICEASVFADSRLKSHLILTLRVCLN